MKATLTLVAAGALSLIASSAMAGVIAAGGGTYNARGIAANELAGAAGQIIYHNGPVMTNTKGVNVYVIWYGNWTGNTATTIIPEFLNHLGGSAYYNINTTYYDASGAHIKNLVTLAGQTNDNYSQGTSLSDAKILTIVKKAMKSGALPKDANGLYFVLTSKDVNETSGFCSQYCGWHTNGTMFNKDIKYSFVGDAARCLSGCAAQSTGPNGNAGADGMLSVIAHELEETVTDPDPESGWAFATGAENADQCAWTFGTEYTAANGAKANMNINGHDYLIQQNWIQSSAGKCALHL
jgi:phosphate-induced protein 1